MFEPIPEKYVSWMLYITEIDELIDANRNDVFLVEVLTDLKKVVNTL